MNRQEQLLIDGRDYTPELNDRLVNISVTWQKSNVMAETVRSTDVKNADMTVEIPEFPLISEHSTGDNVESVDEEIIDMIAYLWIKATRLTFLSISVKCTKLCNACRWHWAQTKIDTNRISASRMQAENQVSSRIQYRLEFNDHRTVCGTVPMFVCFGDFRLRVWFGVVNIFPALILIRTLYSDQFEMDLFPQKWIIVFVPCCPDSILSA